MQGIVLQPQLYKHVHVLEHKPCTCYRILKNSSINHEEKTKEISLLCP